MTNINLLKERLKKLNNIKLEESILKSFNKDTIKGGSKESEKEDIDSEDYKHEIIFENNTEYSINKFRALKEFKLREKFIKFNGVKEEEEKNTSSFWFFN
jgi:nicotinamide riboside kinase